ncbi:MAG: major outer membrane protein OmpA [bacterium P3]|nr:MAG: major outer membrane protein OmpA [bacterium P3]KWW42648.1 MAG: major outer membrane protein OmpA [bacterium F083]
MFMKKKILLLFAVALAASVSAQVQPGSTSSQTTTHDSRSVTTTSYQMELVRTNRFANNWELSFSLGPQFYIGEYDWEADFIDWWTFPSFDVTLTKWASPLFGVGFGLSYSRYKGLSVVGDADATFYDADDKIYTTKDGHTYIQSKGGYLSMNFYGTLNLTNIFGGGYKPERRYQLEAYMGGGLLLAVHTDVTQFGVAFQAGLRNQWMINDRWSIDATLRGSLVSEDFDGEGWDNSDQRSGNKVDNFPLDGVFGVMVGATYRFGFDRTDPVAYTWMPTATIIRDVTENVAEETRQEVIREMTVINNEQLDKVAAAATLAGVDVQRLTGDKDLAERARIAAPNYVDYITQAPAPAPQVVRVATKFWIPIHFVIDKWNISHYEEVSIIAAADAIKALPEDVKISVAGYADIQTATAAHNQMLSEKRANAVADMLVNKYGVSRDRLVISAKGGVENMFLDDNKVSRCVIISVAE